MGMYTFHYRVDRIKGTPSRDTFQLFAAYSLVADYNTRGLHLPQCIVDLIHVRVESELSDHHPLVYT